MMTAGMGKQSYQDEESRNFIFHNLKITDFPGNSGHDMGSELYLLIDSVFPELK